MRIWRLKHRKVLNSLYVGYVQTAGKLKYTIYISYINISFLSVDTNKGQHMNAKF